MNKLLIFGFLSLALVISACDQQSSINGPVAPANTQVNLAADESAALADPGDGMDLRGAAMDRELMAILGLIMKANPDMDDAQKALLKAAIDEYNKNRALILRNKELSAEEKKAQLETLKKDLLEQIFGPGNAGGILNPDQIQKYEELKKQIEEQQKERREKWLEQRIEREVQMWTKALTLTTDQQDALRDLIRQREAAIADARKNITDRAELAAALKAIQERFNAAVIEIPLTPEQLAIWERMHGKKGGNGGGTGSTIDQQVEREIQMFTKLLTLTVDQQVPFKDILKIRAEAMAKARSEIKDPALLAAELKKIEEAFDAAVKAMSPPLTAEQLAIWEKYRKTSTGGGIGRRG